MPPALLGDERHASAVPPAFALRRTFRPETCFAVNGAARRTLLQPRPGAGQAVQAAAHEGKPFTCGGRLPAPRPLCSREPVSDDSVIAFQLSEPS